MPQPRIRFRLSRVSGGATLVEPLGSSGRRAFCRWLRSARRPTASVRPRFGEWVFGLMVKQDTRSGAVEVLVLPVAQRPEKGGKADGTHRQRYRNKNAEISHELPPRMEPLANPPVEIPSAAAHWQ
jgi:hypothetical protein